MRWTVDRELAALRRAVNGGGVADSGEIPRSTVSGHGRRVGDRVFLPGLRIGGWTLIEAIESGKLGWRARCECGTVSKINPSQAAARAEVGLAVRCRECEARRRAALAAARPYLCLTCGKSDPSKFKVSVKFACEACARAAARNGRHACGRAIRYERGGRSHTAHRALPCACGDPAPRSDKPPRARMESVPALPGNCACGVAVPEGRVLHCSDRCRVRHSDRLRRARGRPSRA